MKTYIVELTFTQHSRTEVSIKAGSLSEARSKASEITADQIEGWKPFDGEVSVENVAIKPKEISQ